jgi:hypothetical protein
LPLRVLHGSGPLDLSESSVDDYHLPPGDDFEHSDQERLAVLAPGMVDGEEGALARKGDGAFKVGQGSFASPL